MNRPHLRKVVKVVRGKKRSTKRAYWVKSNPAHPTVSPKRAKMADAAAWLKTSAVNQGASYAGRAAGRAVGGMVGAALTPFHSPFAYVAAKSVGGFVGSSAAQLLLRPVTVRTANWVERRVAGGPIQRNPRKFWLRGSGL